jgi:hypothetical protein
MARILDSQDSDSGRTPTPLRTGEEMAKEEKKEVRIIYKRDSDLTKVGFLDFVEAQAVAHELKQKYPEPQYRIRTRLRTRNNGWDVVVKVRTEVPA